MKNYNIKYGRIWNGNLTSILFVIILLLKLSFDKVIDLLFTIYCKSIITKHGKNLKIQYGARIRYPNSINIGDNVKIGKKVEMDSELESGYLYIGSFSQINRNCQLDFSGGIIIGEHSLLSENVCIYTHSHGYDPLSHPKSSKLKIGNNVWIGANAIVFENVKYINDNSIIGAGSIVTKNVESNTIVAGNPARIIKTLKNLENK